MSIFKAKKHAEPPVFHLYVLSKWNNRFPPRKQVEQTPEHQWNKPRKTLKTLDFFVPKGGTNFETLMKLFETLGGTPVEQNL